MSPNVALAAGIALKGTLVLAVALVLSRFLRGQPAALRHTVWTAAFASILLIPVLSLLLPPIPVLPVDSRSVPLAAVAGPGPIGPAGSVAPTAPSAAAAPAPATTPLAPAIGRGPSAVAAPRTARAPQPARVGISNRVSPEEVGPAVPDPGTDRRSGVPLLLLLWLAGAGLSLGWVLLGELSVRRLTRGARPARGPAWSGLIRDLECRGALPASVRVLETDRPIVPFTIGVFRPVVLVPAAGRRWSEEHRRQVLIHELAHVRRQDCLTHFLGRVACAIHWFNPLAWVGLRQARLEREHACDDVVLSAGSQPSGYAESLLATAAGFRTPVGLRTAGLALARRSHLSERLLAVLDPTRPRTGPGAGRIGAVFALGAVLTLPVAAAGPAWRDPGFAAPRAATSSSGAVPAPMGPALGPGAIRSWAPIAVGPANGPSPALPARQEPVICPPARNGSARSVKLTSSMTITGQGTASDGSNSFVVWTGARCSVVIHLTGNPTFNDAETDVATLTPGARFTITHTDDDVDRVYDVRSRGGQLERSYTVDGRAAPMDAQFERWRATLILEYIRRSGYDAVGRTKRILSQRGVDGVLDEIAHIESDWAAGQYFRALLASERVTDADASRVIEAAGAALESDYELGRVLAAVPAARLEAEPARQAFVKAVGTMESDYEKRRALEGILRTGSLSPALTGQLLGIAGSIGSDYELASLLIGLAQRGAVTGQFDDAYMAAVKTIESDYEKHRVLSALLKSGPRSAATLRAGLEVGATIDSDYELGRWLAEVAASPGGVTEALRPAFFAAVRSIESSHERSQALLATLERKNPPAALVADVIEAAGGIDSDFELAQVLTTIAERGLVTDAVKPAFRRVLDQVGSSYERQRVLAALGERATER